MPSRPSPAPAGVRRSRSSCSAPVSTRRRRRNGWCAPEEAFAGPWRRRDRARCDAARMTADPFARIRAKPTKTIIGLISGTSADGITAAAVEITDRRGDRPGISLRGWTTTPYPAGVRQRLVDMFTEPATMQEAASLNYLLGELFASAALAAAQAAGYEMDSVDLIASHGQTVAHVAAGDPADPLSRAATLQL